MKYYFNSIAEIVAFEKKAKKPFAYCFKINEMERSDIERMVISPAYKYVCMYALD